MTMSSIGYAKLSDDSYRHHVKKEVEIGGVTYKILDQVSKPSGYQGTIYQRLDTNEIIVAHRGTEFDRQIARDVIFADGGMVLAGVNIQANDAIALTRHALELAVRQEAKSGHRPPVTVTGHSLGGTLAQITAHECGLKSETFNAYGAAGLLHGVSAGGGQVVNHVRATDFVSAASRHFGEVRGYATVQDIAFLDHRGYENDRTFDLRNPITTMASGYAVNAHRIKTFHSQNDLTGDPVLSEENRQRYRDHKDMIDKYRGDVFAVRHGISGMTRWQDAKPLMDWLNESAARRDQAREEQRAQRDAARQAAPPPLPGLGGGPIRADDPAWNYERAIETLGEGARRRPSSPNGSDTGKLGPVSGQKPLLNDPRHTDYALFRGAADGVYAIDARHNRTPDARSDQLAASLAVEARRGGLHEIDHVVMSTDARHTFAIQGRLDDPAHHRTHVETVPALDTPLVQSTQRMAQVDAEQTQRMQRQVVTQPQVEDNTSVQRGMQP